MFGAMLNWLGCLQTGLRRMIAFELAVPPPLNLVCFRHRGGDEINQQLMDRLNQSGDIYLTHTSMHDRFTLRFASARPALSSAMSSMPGAEFGKKLRRWNLGHLGLQFFFVGAT